MAETKLKTRSPFVAAEALDVGASAEPITAASGTIPQNTGRIHFYVPASKTIRWVPNGTPTTSLGHLVSAQNWGVLEHNQHGAKLKSGDSGDVALIIVYERGAGRADAAYSLTAPY